MINMRPLPASLFTGLLTGLALAACSSTPDLSASVATGNEATTTEVESLVSDAPSFAGYAPQGQTYTVVAVSLLDPTSLPTSGEMKAITSEQGEFMDWLRLNGGLVAAGPVVPPRDNSSVRQLMFFDTEDSDAALERCCEGPASGTGLYGTEASRFVTTTDLSQVGANVLSGSGSALRPYVIVTGPSSLAMTATFGKMGSLMLCQGDCVDGVLRGRSLAILDCTDVDDARLFMGEVCSSTEGLSYHAWIGPVAFSALR